MFSIEQVLGKILTMFSFERHQYMDIKQMWENTDDKSDIKNVCDAYGAEHLARLLGKPSDFLSCLHIH